MSNNNKSETDSSEGAPVIAVNNQFEHRNKSEGIVFKFFAFLSLTDHEEQVTIVNLNEKLKNKQKHHQYLQLKLYFYSLFRMLYIIKLIVKSEYGGHPSPRPIHHDSDSGGHHRPYPTRLYVC